MKQIIFTLFFFLVVGNVFGQYQGDDCRSGHWDETGNWVCDEYQYYDAHDVDKLLAIQAANPQANLNWTGNYYRSWYGCYWQLGTDNLMHLTGFGGYGFTIQLTSLDLSGCTSLTNFYFADAISQVISLNVSGCTSLTTLRCDEIQLTMLDVSGCTSLTNLDCSFNQLPALDVSGCTSLTNLDCSDNQLLSLDVSDCKNLISLSCGVNQLLALDVSDCKNLTSLGCGVNQLASLDVSGCKKLTSLGCAYNQLLSLDVSDCKNLTSLSCSVNQLPALDVSNCKNLTDLGFEGNPLISLDVSGCTSLTTLWCQNNQLPSLDVSKCTSLTTLWCGYNQLPSLDVSKCTSLTKLDCSNNQLPSLDVSSCKNLTDLYCKDNQLISLDVSGCASLTTLWCYNNQLTDENLPALYGLHIEPYDGSNGGYWHDYDYYPPGIYFDLLGNKGFTESAIQQLAANLPNISYDQILYDKLPDYSVELWSSDGSLPMKGVAGDGAAQLRIRVNIPDDLDVSTVTKIEFFEKDLYPINELVDGQIRMLDGSPITNPPQLTSGNRYFEFLYTAPDAGNVLLYDLPEWALNFTAGFYFKDDLIVDEKVDFTIQIIRPPLLMVHGLGGSFDTFSKMAFYFENSKYYEWQCYPINYSGTNTASFYQNQSVIPDRINQLLLTCKINQYAAKKVDIVAHSMGGLLTRQYLQSGEYRIRDDINKFITLNTPHSGSQGANLLIDMIPYIDALNTVSINIGQTVDYTAIMECILFLDDSEPWTKLIDDIYGAADGKRAEYYNKFNNFAKSEAVDNLRVNSDAIKNLRINETNSNHKVPIHAIYTTTDFNSFMLKTAPIPYIAIAVNEYMIALMTNIFANNFVKNDLYKEDNDMIVAASSQMGGLNGNQISFIPNQWHCSTENPSEIAEVDKLLSLPKTSDAFSTQGFAPPILGYITPNLLSALLLRSSTNASDFKIVSVDKPNCTSNDLIQIHITGSSDINSMLLMIQGDGGNTYMELRNGNDNGFTYTVPEEAIGNKKILAIGYTTSQTALIDTASLNVSTSASLLSISTSPENGLLVPLNGSQQVQVLGSYSDGTTKNISYLDNVLFEIKGNNAGLEAPNTITGLREGVDTLVVSCQGLEAYLPVQVIDVGLAPTALKPPVVKAQEMLKCYPNPAKDQVTIAYDLPESCSFAHLNMYDVKGQKVKAVELKNKNAGSHEETISIGNIPKGVYIVVLSTDKGSSYQKLLKN